MSEAIPESYPPISPYLYYRDGEAAMRFLVEAFGFRERFCTTDETGQVRHAEVELNGGVVMLGCPPDYKTPKQLGQTTVGVYVHVTDVDAHYAQAKAAGAEIQGAGPEDQDYGVRSYGAIDPEGHQWWFAQPLAR